MADDTRTPAQVRFDGVVEGWKELLERCKTNPLPSGKAGQKKQLGRVLNAARCLAAEGDAERQAIVREIEAGMKELES